MNLYTRDGRTLTLWEEFVTALTASLAVATVALAVAGSARAGLGGALPGDGPYTSGPATAILHAESIPGDPAVLR